MRDFIVEFVDRNDKIAMTKFIEASDIQDALEAAAKFEIPGAAVMAIIRPEKALG